MLAYRFSFNSYDHRFEKSFRESINCAQMVRRSRFKEERAVTKNRKSGKADTNSNVGVENFDGELLPGLLQNISIDLIEDNPNQVRKDFNQVELEDLAQSIKEEGLIHPIVVCTNNGKYVLVAGERRLRACRGILMQRDIPAIVLSSSDNIQAITIAENVQRVPLDLIEQASLIELLSTNKKLTQAEIGKPFGFNQTKVSQLRSLARADQRIKDTYKANIARFTNTALLEFVVKFSHLDVELQLELFNVVLAQRRQQNFIRNCIRDNGDIVNNLAEDHEEGPDGHEIPDNQNEDGALWLNGQRLLGGDPGHENARRRRRQRGNEFDQVIRPPDEVIIDIRESIATISRNIENINELIAEYRLLRRSTPEIINIKDFRGEHRKLRMGPPPFQDIDLFDIVNLKNIRMTIYGMYAGVFKSDFDGSDCPELIFIEEELEFYEKGFAVGGKSKAFYADELQKLHKINAEFVKIIDRMQDYHDSVG